MQGDPPFSRRRSPNRPSPNSIPATSFANQRSIQGISKVDFRQGAMCAYDSSACGEGRVGGLRLYRSATRDTPETDRISCWRPSPTADRTVVRWNRNPDIAILLCITRPFRPGGALCSSFSRDYGIRLRSPRRATVRRPVEVYGAALVTPLFLRL